MTRGRRFSLGVYGAISAALIVGSWWHAARQKSAIDSLSKQNQILETAVRSLATSLNLPVDSSMQAIVNTIAQRLNRANLQFAEAAPVQNSQNSGYAVNVTVTNNGNADAKDIRMFLGAYLANKPLTIEEERQKIDAIERVLLPVKKSPNTDTPLVPGNAIVGPVSNFSISKKDLAAINSGTNALYVFLVARYQDDQTKEKYWSLKSCQYYTVTWNHIHACLTRAETTLIDPTDDAPAALRQSPEQQAIQGKTSRTSF